jgi:hypothetical protein
MCDAITLFDTAEEAWFWFMASYDARQAGARIKANEGLYKRPCEPSDILKICERLRRHRRLDMNHFRVLRHYGQRMIAPDPTRVKEVLSSRLAFLPRPMNIRCLCAIICLNRMRI